ncbi:hypothetical protein KVR01_012374 [Diaporthe batatas]|uniref:uncharacterized protein n=1 Tax=Diaporthe batatas TaxID=748121 RepID=UPI001D05785E|nr:uncharacterized protein KVR01_012374 [Diaporthe batatas]KAG8157712.1 hypothetical protein KVR01_012374 [Diaporthe batatas]
MANPTNLPPRYEIRKLEPEHAQWVGAIMCHSNVFHSTIFPNVYPEAMGARFNRMMQGAGYLVHHQISSGMSIGVFDKEYQYKKPESALTNGRFYWDPEHNDYTREELLEAMDFPLVSIALCYDGIDKLDNDRMEPLVATLPVFGTCYAELDRRDPRPLQSWRPAKRRGEILMRNATSTRYEYEGKGIMGALARHLMRDAAARGYKAVNIECFNDAVTHVWSEPPSPFKGEVVASFRTDEYEEEHDGKKVKPFASANAIAKQLITRVWTTLSD